MNGAHPDMVIVDESDITIRRDATGTVLEWPVVEGAAGYVLREPSNEDRLDELDEAFRDVYPGRGRVWVGPPMLLHDDDADGTTWIRGTSTVQHFAPRRFGHTAELAHIVEAWSAAVAEAGRRLAPVFEAAARSLAEAVAHCEAVGLIEHEQPLDPRERALAAKRAPGRTGPPAPRMDGRRSR